MRSNRVMLPVSEAVINKVVANRGEKIRHPANAYAFQTEPIRPRRSARV